ncbi:MAG: NAD(P)H-hydrate dehydratase [Pseudomonadota bacterium]
MTELLTAAQMRAIEQAAIDSGAVTGLELMERAGRGVVDAILEWRPELATAPHRAVVLCGPGNNGGDGFVVARLLHQRGWEVEVFLYGDEAQLPHDAAENARRWRELGGVRGWDDEQIEDRLDTREDDVVVDALFGTGLRRPMPTDTERTWHGFVPHVFVDDVPRYVAVDMPSGICSESGANLEGALPANLTVTFHRPKLGHFLSSHRKLEGGPNCCGALNVVGIGLTKSAKNAVHLARRPGDSAKALGHKYHHGQVLILSGEPGKGGAARLAARGALRIGAGLVTVGCPRAALTENAARLDAIMLAVIDSADALSAEIASRRVKALCIGPGFGLGKHLRTVVRTALSAKLAVVLDADALTEYREDPDTLFSMLHEDCVLTPHEGEFGRLFQDILAKLKAPATRGPAYSKVDATREAAKRAGCVVLFKGADTVIANPSGRCTINSAHYDRAAPWLATAGSGDVLAGFITGLLARGFSPMQAAESAAWLHVECALKFGPGLIAEDLPEQLPAVFRDLGQ